MNFKGQGLYTSPCNDFWTFFLPLQATRAVRATYSSKRASDIKQRRPLETQPPKCVGENATKSPPPLPRPKRYELIVLLRIPSPLSNPRTNPTEFMSASRAKRRSLLLCFGGGGGGAAAEEEEAEIRHGGHTRRRRRRSHVLAKVLRALGFASSSQVGFRFFFFF